jgi:hypothetical protein
VNGVEASRHGLRDSGPTILVRAPSSSSNLALFSNPPANPVRLPEAPMTRWQGIMIDKGFLLLARPTAREAEPLPIARAS